MYIEFVGSNLQFHPADAHQCDAEVFVAILGCSQLTYVEAVESQHKEDLMRELLIGLKSSWDNISCILLLNNYNNDIHRN